MSQLKIKDGNSWINIPAGGIGVPSGGTAGQVLTKSSATDYATEWAFLMPTDYSFDETTTGTNEQVKTYTVSGNGFIIVACSVISDVTSDTGSGYTIIEHNGTEIMGSGNRISSATGIRQGAACTVCVIVQNGDTFKITQRVTKNGTKKYFRHFACFYCSVSEEVTT